MAMRTARQKAALRKAQLASARKRRKGGRKKKPGAIFNRGNNFVRKGKTPTRRIARGAGLAVAVGYTPYGFAYIGSGIRKKANKKKRK